MKTYKSLYKRYKTQAADEIFSLFRSDTKKGEDWETPFAKLVTPEMAKPEEWNFRRPEFQRLNQHYPILTSYLNYTFLRLQEQGRIAYSKDQEGACFNTGLQTVYEKDIYATFARTTFASERKQPDWTFAGWFDSYSERLTDFRPLPEIATYITDASDLVFDIEYGVDINCLHIYEQNQERLPSAIRGNRSLAVSALEGAARLLKHKVVRNYKIAIPHWYESHIQLLLPLKIDDSNPEAADLALVADKDKAGLLYRIRTALSMDMAYLDARLITRPDREWLNP
jgi:hypothetical protein